MNSRISGAIYDFAGYLTTLSPAEKFGANVEASPMADHIVKWAKERGFEAEDLNGADVQNWNKPTAIEWLAESVGEEIDIGHS